MDLFLHEDISNQLTELLQTIAAVATALLQVAQPEFKAYAKQVISNARTLAEALVSHGYRLQTGGSDNHLVLWDLRPIGLTGSKVEKVCDLMGITINSTFFLFFLPRKFPYSFPYPISENAVSGDASAQVPGGIRLGTSALTSRDMREEDIKVVADFLHRAVQLSLLLQKEAKSKLLKDFVRVATTPAEGNQGYLQVKQLRDEVAAFASKWPLPGIDVSTLQKPTGLHEY
jgi:glycine hydroxymethyltransferase